MFRTRRHAAHPLRHSFETDRIKAIEHIAIAGIPTLNKALFEGGDDGDDEEDIEPQEHDHESPGDMQALLAGLNRSEVSVSCV